MNQGANNYILSFKVDIDTSTWYVWEDSILDTELKDHSLKGFDLSSDYMFRVTEGTCTNTDGVTKFQGIMLSGSDSLDYDSSIVLNCALCINPQDVELATNFP